jgi:hypothetical protein
MLDAAWREYSVETPPPALDAAILGAAHREARSRPRPLSDDDDTLAEAREPSRWWWGLAAAATIGAIAFGIVQVAPPLLPGESMVASDVPAEPRARKVAAPPTAPVEPTAATRAPAPAAHVPDAPPQAAPPPAAPPKAKLAAPAAVPDRSAASPAEVDARTAIGSAINEQNASERPRQRSDEGPTAKRETPLPAAVPPPLRDAPDAALARDRANAPRPFPSAPQAAPTPPAELKKLEVERRQAPVAQPETRERASSPPVPSAAPMTPPATLTAPRAMRSQEAQPSALGAAAPAAIAPPAEFIARIEALLAAGNGDEAARELNRFRAAYLDADQRLPQAMRTWAATVERKP